MAMSIQVAHLVDQRLVLVEQLNKLLLLFVTLQSL